MGSDLGVSHCQAGDESVCDFEWDDGHDCLGRRVIENTSERKLIHSNSE